MDPITEFLEINGPALSNDIARHLICEKGTSPVAARKRISRGGQDLSRDKSLLIAFDKHFVRNELKPAPNREPDLSLLEQD